MRPTSYIILTALCLLPMGCNNPPQTAQSNAASEEPDNRVIMVEPPDDSPQSDVAQPVPQGKDTTPPSTTGADGNQSESGATTPPAQPAPAPPSNPNAPSFPSAEQRRNLQKLPSGVQYKDLKAGTGASPKQGQWVRVNYTGWLEDGTKFDSSFDRGEPFEFTLGGGEMPVIPGWDEGVKTMKIGGRRLLVIPSDMAYGPGGQGPIPPNATLIFIVDLLGVRS